jgi:glycosyltransferase involved in cell wall biosynthesis
MTASVDICMITYNQKDYVGRAIESILQQTYPHFHLIICDDHSTDGTAEICENYQRRFPDKISFFPNSRNVGMMPNFINCLLTAKSDYVAICEGDDYWTNSEKLQLQVNFLDSHPDYIMSFHNADVINDTGDKIIRKFYHYRKDTYEGEELLLRWIIPTASVLFRNILQEPLPDYFQNSTHGDLALFLFLAQFGKIGCIDKTMSAYRINEQSVTLSHFKGIDHNERHIEQCKEMITFFYPRYNKLLKTRISDYLCSTAYLYACDKKKNRALFCLKKAIESDWLIGFKKIKYFTGTIIRLVFPL